MTGGVDGCRGGWVLATSGPDGTVEVRRMQTFAEIAVLVRDGDIDALGVDMPIGLPAAGPRTCDGAARARLGPRRSSVFPAPPRALLDCHGWDDALATARRLQGHGISLQVFNILDKVAEVDRELSPALQERVVEVHPELAFARLAGTPLRHSKRRPAGRAERLAALGLDSVAPVAGAAPDDVLDALAVLSSTRRWRAGTATRLGGDERDERGLRMEIVF